jgi:hypothetical protein
MRTNLMSALLAGAITANSPSYAQSATDSSDASTGRPTDTAPHYVMLSRYLVVRRIDR